MKIKIVSIEKYLPKNQWSSEQLDEIAQGKIGRIEKNTGVKNRYHVSEEENIAEIGSEALKKALTSANLSVSDVELLLYAGTSYDYPVPNNSVLIKAKVATDSDLFPCIDIDTTCLSFIHAMDVAHLYLEARRYKRIAIVCAEISSRALTPSDEKVFGLFGDAAVAIILERSEEDGYTIQYNRSINFPSGAMYANVPIGGAVNRGINTKSEDQGYYFHMDGKNLIRLTTKHIGTFVQEMERDLGYTIKNFRTIITHQASKFGNEFFLKHFNLQEPQVIETLGMYGNCISASIPLGLEYFWNSRQNTSPDKILLLGSGAGLSLAAMVLDFSK